MKTTLNIKRGDVFFAALPSSDGTSRQTGNRPIVVISNELCNRYSPIVSVVALSSSTTKHKLPTHISLSAKDTGLKMDSICLCEQPLSIAKSELINYVTTLSTEHMEKVSNGLRIQLDL